MSRIWPVIILLAGVLDGRAGGESAAPATDQASIRRHVAALRARRATPEQIERAVGDLVALGEPGTAALGMHVDHELARLAATGAARPKTAAVDEEIDTLRDTLRTLRGDPEPSKERLQEVGLPTLESLTAACARREAALAPWRAKRAAADAEAERLALCVAAWQASATDGGAQAHAARLDDLRKGLVAEDPKSLRVAAENERIAGSLPGDVVPGMMAVNEIRLTCGLSPLVFDPKLCEAAVMHSGDMERHGFFAHESPLPGKQTPWDRAKLAGTTASGENIFMGSTVGGDAIKAWFLSPGHHKNMFGEGHTRQGLGRSGKHWTQLFGAE
ncbi:MAG: CAP domain-containing protein [Planctomycetota bacterium]